MSALPEKMPLWKGCAVAAFLPCLACSGITLWLLAIPPPPPDTRSPAEKLAEAGAVLHLEFPASTELLYYHREPDFERRFKMVLRMPDQDYDRFARQKWMKEARWSQHSSRYYDAENFADSPFHPRNPEVLISGQLQTRPSPEEKVYFDGWAIDMLIDDSVRGSRTLYIFAFDLY